MVQSRLDDASPEAELAAKAFWKMRMMLLVTGGAGFIGSHFIDCWLARGGDELLICLDNFNDYYDPALKRANVARFAGHPRLTVVEQSFNDLPAMRKLLVDGGVRKIVHLGAYAGVRASIAQPLVYEEHNVRGTLALLEAARGIDLDRFLLVSSSTVYGPEADVPFQEDAPLGTPLSPYGATKRAAELLGFTYQRLHGVPVVCLRPFSVYGPRIRPDLALWIFADAIVGGRPLPLLGDGTMRRDFTHVSDICRGLISALDAPQAVGEAINLGHDQPIAIAELLEMLQRALGKTAIIERRTASPADMPISCADLGKAERLLGYRPQVDFAAGLAEFAAWFLSLRR